MRPQSTIQYARQALDPHLASHGITDPEAAERRGGVDQHASEIVESLANHREADQQGCCDTDCC